MALGNPASTQPLLGIYNVDEVPSLTMQSGATISGGTNINIGASIGGVASGSYSQASNTTLANVTGMVANLVAGATYAIEGYLAVTNNNTGGIKLNLGGGTVTATNFMLDTWIYNTTTLTGESNITALSSNMVAAAIAATAVQFSGSITVNAAGTLQLQAAQDVSNSTALTIANGSFIVLTRIA